MLPPGTDITDISLLIRTDPVQNQKRQGIQKLCHEYNDVFQQTNEQLIVTKIIKNHIRTKDEKLLHAEIYLFPNIRKEKINPQIHEM